MKIEITVAEYFEQLILMEQQYGQEEELYPWIYMLLQMVEQKKREKLNNSYKRVSIRDVHNWKKKGAPKNMVEGSKKNILNTIGSENGGPPEILFFDYMTSEYLGCVEIKKLNCGDWIPIKETEEGTKDSLKVEPYDYEKGIEFEVLSCSKKVVIKNDFENEKLGIFKKMKSELEKNNIVAEIMNCKREKCGERYTYTFEAIIYDNEAKMKKDKLKKDNYFEAINEKTLRCYEEEQIKNHLKRFGKVIYTNGMEFYYLRLKGCKNIQIEISKIADLSSHYKKYLDEASTGNWVSEEKAEIEWGKLIDKLSGIDWHSEPTVKIFTDNKED